MCVACPLCLISLGLSWCAGLYLQVDPTVDDMMMGHGGNCTISTLLEMLPPTDQDDDYDTSALLDDTSALLDDTSALLDDTRALPVEQSRVDPSPWLLLT